MANYLTNFTITGDRLTNEQRDEQTNWRISPRIWSESAATLVRSFVASSVDYCNALLAGAPKATTNKLQRGLNAACGQRYPQVRSRLVATPRYRATLAGCSWASRVQARRHGVQHACTVKRLRTSWNCASQSQVSHHGNIFDPPSVPYSRTAPPAQLLCHLAYGRRAFCVAGSSSGILCRTACGVPLLAGIVSDNLWRRFYS